MRCLLCETSSVSLRWQASSSSFRCLTSSSFFLFLLIFFFFCVVRIFLSRCYIPTGDEKKAFLVCSLSFLLNFFSPVSSLSSPKRKKERMHRCNSLIPVCVESLVYLYKRETKERQDLCTVFSFLLLFLFFFFLASWLLFVFFYTLKGKTNEERRKGGSNLQIVTTH